MKVFNDNGKVVFDDVFDVTKIDKTTIDFDGETLLAKYNDSKVVKALDMVLYDFMSAEGWLGNDSEKTELYINGDYDNDTFCKPLPYEKSDFLPEDAQAAMDDYDFQLWRLNQSQNGWETTCIDIELTDSEKQQLEKIVESMLVKVVE
jgi:hypothetical protein